MNPKYTYFDLADTTLHDLLVVYKDGTQLINVYDLKEGDVYYHEYVPPVVTTIYSVSPDQWHTVTYPLMQTLQGVAKFMAETNQHLGAENSQIQREMAEKLATAIETHTKELQEQLTKAIDQTTGAIEAGNTAQVAQVAEIIAAIGGTAVPGGFEAFIKDDYAPFKTEVNSEIQQIETKTERIDNDIQQLDTKTTQVETTAKQAQEKANDADRQSKEAHDEAVKAGQQSETALSSAAEAKATAGTASDTAQEAAAHAVEALAKSDSAVSEANKADIAAGEAKTKATKALAEVQEVKVDLVDTKAAVQAVAVETEDLATKSELYLSNFQNFALHPTQQGQWEEQALFLIDQNIYLLNLLPNLYDGLTSSITDDDDKKAYLNFLGFTDEQIVNLEKRDYTDIQDALQTRLNATEEAIVEQIIDLQPTDHKYTTPAQAKKDPAYILYSMQDMITELDKRTQTIGKNTLVKTELKVDEKHKVRAAFTFDGEWSGYLMQGGRLGNNPIYNNSADSTAGTAPTRFKSDTTPVGTQFIFRDGDVSQLWAITSIEPEYNSSTGETSHEFKIRSDYTGTQKSDGQSQDGILMYGTNQTTYANTAKVTFDISTFVGTGRSNPGSIDKFSLSGPHVKSDAVIAAKINFLGTEQFGLYCPAQNYEVQVTTKQLVLPTFNADNSNLISMPFSIDETNEYVYTMEGATFEDPIKIGAPIIDIDTLDIRTQVNHLLKIYTDLKERIMTVEQVIESLGHGMSAQELRVKAALEGLILTVVNTALFFLPGGIFASPFVTFGLNVLLDDMLGIPPDLTMAAINAANRGVQVFTTLLMARFGKDSEKLKLNRITKFVQNIANRFPKFWKQTGNYRPGEATANIVRTQQTTTNREQAVSMWQNMRAKYPNTLRTLGNRIGRHVEEDIPLLQGVRTNSVIAGNSRVDVTTTSFMQRPLRETSSYRGINVTYSRLRAESLEEVQVSNPAFLSSVTSAIRGIFKNDKIQITTRDHVRLLDHMVEETGPSTSSTMPGEMTSPMMYSIGATPSAIMAPANYYSEAMYNIEGNLDTNPDRMDDIIDTFFEHYDYLNKFSDMYPYAKISGIAIADLKLDDADSDYPFFSQFGPIPNLTYPVYNGSKLTETIQISPLLAEHLAIISVEGVRYLAPIKPDLEIIEIDFHVEYSQIEGNEYISELIADNQIVDGGFIDKDGKFISSDEAWLTQDTGDITMLMVGKPIMNYEITQQGGYTAGYSTPVTTNFIARFNHPINGLQPANCSFTGTFQAPIIGKTFGNCVAGGFSTLTNSYAIFRSNSRIPYIENYFPFYWPPNTPVLPRFIQADKSDAVHDTSAQILWAPIPGYHDLADPKDLVATTTWGSWYNVTKDQIFDPRDLLAPVDSSGRFRILLYSARDKFWYGYSLSFLNGDDKITMLVDSRLRVYPLWYISGDKTVYVQLGNYKPASPVMGSVTLNDIVYDPIPITDLKYTMTPKYSSGEYYSSAYVHSNENFGNCFLLAAVSSPNETYGTTCPSVRGPGDYSLYTGKVYLNENVNQIYQLDSRRQYNLVCSDGVYTNKIFQYCRINKPCYAPYTMVEADNVPKLDHGYILVLISTQTVGIDNFKVWSDDDRRWITWDFKDFWARPRANPSIPVASLFEAFSITPFRPVNLNI